MRYQKGHAGSKPQTYVEEDRGYETPCWIWQGASDGSGYPMRRDKRRAHVVALIEAGGTVPPHGHVHHLCDVRPCVNPTHLVGLTRRDHRLAHVGKLTDERAREVYASTDHYREAAVRFGLSPSYVRAIRAGRRLAHITGATPSGQ